MELYSPKRTDARIRADQQKDEAAKIAAKKAARSSIRNLQSSLGLTDDNKWMAEALALGRRAWPDGSNPNVGCVIVSDSLGSSSDRTGAVLMRKGCGARPQAAAPPERPFIALEPCQCESDRERMIFFWPLGHHEWSLRQRSIKRTPRQSASAAFAEPEST